MKAIYNYMVKPSRHVLPIFQYEVHDRQADVQSSTWNCRYTPWKC
jgi:hypothetical protein